MFVFEVENVGYEDYAYATHIIKYYEYYQYNNTKIVFTQCGIDHCPNILDTFEARGRVQQVQVVVSVHGVIGGLGRKERMGQ